MRDFEFVQKENFSGSIKTASFSGRIPDFELCFQSPKLFAVKVISLSKGNKEDFQTTENALLVKGKKVAWISKRKDSSLAEAITQNIKFAASPESFALKVVESYSETLLEFLGIVEASFGTTEDLILKNKTRQVMERIFSLKKNLMKVRIANRKYLRLVSLFSRQSNKAYKDSISLYEKLMHVDELIGNYDDLLSNLIDAHLSVISNRLNQVMKVLTIIATIALPVTAISSIYGMNVSIPGQQSQNALPFIILLMAGITVAMLLVFLKLGWFKEKD